MSTKYPAIPTLTLHPSWKALSLVRVGSFPPQGLAICWFWLCPFCECQPWQDMWALHRHPWDWESGLMDFKPGCMTRIRTRWLDCWSTKDTLRCCHLDPPRCETVENNTIQHNWRSFLDLYLRSSEFLSKSKYKQNPDGSQRPASRPLPVLLSFPLDHVKTNHCVEVSAHAAVSVVFGETSRAARWRRWARGRSCAINGLG